jgi:hypothetical protein
MRTDVQPRTHCVALPMQDHGFSIPIDRDFGLCETAIGDAVKCDQRSAPDLAGCVHGLVV